MKNNNSIQEVVKKFNFLNNYDVSKGGQIEDRLPEYECLNERKSWGGAMIGGALENAIKRIDENIIEILSEAVDYIFPDEEKGGIIVFSTDVNSKKLSQTNWVNKIKQFFLTWKQQYKGINKVDAILQKHKLSAWTIGKFFKGKYTDKLGNIYTENSLSVEIIGVNTVNLIHIAEEICGDFNQECVLVKTYYDNRILLVNPEKTFKQIN